jgi:hypothetical protein
MAHSTYLPAFSTMAGSSQPLAPSRRTGFTVHGLTFWMRSISCGSQAVTTSSTARVGASRVTPRAKSGTKTTSNSMTGGSSLRAFSRALARR